MEIVRISVIGIAGILLAVLVKEVRPEYAFYITMAAGLAILFFSVGKLSYLLEALRERIYSDRDYLCEYFAENDRYHVYRSVFSRAL